MSQNITIDPAKKDYVVVNGSPIPSDRVFEASYIAILIPAEKWLYGKPGQGSYVYTLSNIKRSAEIEQRFAQFAQKAIQDQVIDVGRATDSQITNTAQTSTGSVNNISVVPASQNITDIYNFSGV